MFHETPEYVAWVKSVDDKIDGRNSVTRQRHARDFPGYVVIPPGMSEDFITGFKAHAELYNTEIREKGKPNG